LASAWDDFVTLLKEHPLVLEGIVVVLLFTFVLLLFRRVRLVAEELERRKELGDYVRGLDEFLRGDFRDAIRTLERVLERDPENVEGRIALGDCYREVGDPAEAKKHHHHVHKVFGHELARNFVSLGLDELALRNYDRAVEAFERALQLTPGDPDALGGLARAYAEGGNPVTAAQYLRELYPGGPAPDMSVVHRRDASGRFADAGAAVLREGNVESAVRFFSEALAFQPASIRARTGLVRAAHELGDEERARALIDEHIGALRDLARSGEVLFEPAPLQAAPLPAAESAAPSTSTSSSNSSSTLPAIIEDAAGVVQAVEVRTARYHCTQCGQLERDYVEVCPTCRAVGTIGALPAVEELYTMPLDDFREVVDEVEETSAYVQRLARKASTGDADALQRLLDAGPSVLYEVFTALPGIEARRYLGSCMAALGSETAREVRQCHAARGVQAGGGGVQAHDEFAAGYYLSLSSADAESFLVSLGEARDGAVSGALADPRLGGEVRDRACAFLRERGAHTLVAVVEALAASQDPSGIDRAATLVGAWGDAAGEAIEKRYLQATLLGRLFRGRRGFRRRAAADILARSGLKRASEALARAAAHEKDADLRAHYVRAKERAEQKGGKS